MTDDLFPEPRDEPAELRLFLQRIVDCTEITDEQRDDLALLRTRLFAARGYAKAALR